MESPLEHKLLNAYKKDLVGYINEHPEYFNELICLSFTRKQPYSWRAAWLLWSCMDGNDKKVRPYLEDIISNLPTLADEQKRDLFIVLYKMNLNKEQEGKLFNICMDVWEKIGKKPSVRFNAFKLMVRIAGKHPELQNEIGLLSNSPYTDNLSENVKRSLLKMVEK